jgi:Transposase Tn5 dimerisation domain
MALMVKAREMGNCADWLIRSQHNRALPASYEEKLWPTVEAQEPVGTIRFTLRSRRQGKGKTARAAREVCQRLFVKRVALRDGKGGTIEAACIVAQELEPPLGEEAVTWRLLTNREASTPEEVIDLIDWYRARWEIEMFFNVLKNGCRVEAMQLSTIDRVERALALYLIVAWRIAHLMRLGKACPDMDANLLFDPEEIQAAYLLSKKAPPTSAPRLNDVIRLIAQLGGFLGRKSDGEPGVKTLWIGLQRLVDFIAGMRAARGVYV